jgi:peptidoglycan hydrolase FlgJ
MNPLDSNLQLHSLQWQGQAEASKIKQLESEYLNPDAADEKKLKKAAQEFEAIFLQQFLEAMDKTVDRENSVLSGGSSEQYFRSMLNQEISKSMSTKLGGSGFGLAEAIYRQMSQQMKASKEANPNGLAQVQPTLVQGKSNEVKP